MAHKQFRALYWKGLKEEWQKKPPSKRPQYQWLSISDPFASFWDVFFAQDADSSPFWIVRGHDTLRKMQLFVSQNLQVDHGLQFEYSWVPIILSVKEGSVDAGSLIYIPITGTNELENHGWLPEWTLKRKEIPTRYQVEPGTRNSLAIKSEWPIVGTLTTADYSLRNGKYNALGFICMPALKVLWDLQQRQVIVQDRKSPYGRSVDFQIFDEF